MEQIAEAIKKFILEDVNAELTGLESDGITLPPVAEKNIVFGTVDLSRYEAAIIVSILPETQEPDEEFINGFSDRSEFTVTFFFQKEKYSLLVKRMFRYAKAFRTAQAKNPELSSTSDDPESGVEESEITQIKFYPDTGAVAQQMTAFEISFYTDTEEVLDG